MNPEDLNTITEQPKVLAVSNGDGNFIGVSTGQWNVRGFNPDKTPKLVVEVYPGDGTQKRVPFTVHIGHIKEIIPHSLPEEGDTVNTYWHNGCTITEITDEFYNVRVPKGTVTQVRLPEILALNPKYYE